MWRKSPRPPVEQTQSADRRWFACETDGGEVPGKTHGSRRTSAHSPAAVAGVSTSPDGETLDERLVMILVTGATGNVGREVVNLLLEDGQTVRAVTRDPATAALPVAPTWWAVTPPTRRR